MSEKEFSVETLRDVLEYFPETGRLFWRYRDRGLFPTYKAFKTWNGKCGGREAFTSTAVNGYKQGRIFSKNYTAHRVAWAIHYGEWPKGQVDHINGVRIDNRLSNLRIADNRRNQMNRESRGSSEFLGVSFYKSRGVWEANIKISSGHRRIGYFKCEIDAAKAYDAHARKYFGEFANPNFNEDGTRRIRSEEAKRPG